MKTTLIRYAAAGLVLVASSASAQTADHLQCFKIKDDAAKARYTADFAPTNTAFAEVAGCTIKVPAKWICLEAAVSNIAPEAPGPSVDAAAAQTSVCYQTKCPDAAVTTQFTDQFGTHNVVASKTGMVCVPTAPSCTDGIQNGSELGLDCGGGCAPCSGGTGACNKPDDCASGLCVEGFCADADHCTNNVPDADETATDCGGTLCNACTDGSACERGTDCTSGVCAAGTCQVPSCSDNQRNQDETGRDCGGSVCLPCPINDPCLVDSDCASDYCHAGAFCGYDYCFDGMPGTFESGTDCGGECERCPIGQACHSGADCQTGICDSNVCAALACTDPVHNCGGPCGPCMHGGTCTQMMDCMSMSCSAGICD